MTVLSLVSLFSPATAHPLCGPMLSETQYFTGQRLVFERENLIRHPPVPCLTACSMCQGGHTL